MNYEQSGLGESSTSLPQGFKEFMHKVGIDRVKAWHPHGNFNYPLSVDAKCGYCQEFVNLICENPVLHPQSRSFVLDGRCVRCNKKSRVFVDGAKENSCDFQEMWILPKPLERVPLISHEMIENPRISKAYRDALDAFNLGKPSLAITACGRVVEGIGKTSFPSSKDINNIGRLFSNLRGEIKKIPEFKAVLEPLLGLGEALRLGRNPGSHFDLEIDPDMDLAGKVLDLTEFLLQYVFVIGDEAKNVQQLIQKCGPGEED